ncbi:hypothetical protein M3Y95_01165300 [Aphelenchoides besseyi]|nr:hypothetical protein M3Y95_01165300 [Aphelenchoides besseyi]
MFFSISVASSWGGRNYMEDRMVIERLVDDQNNLIGVFLAILDGHGGAQACEHVQRVLWPTIKDMDGFMSQNDSDVLNAMKKAFLKIHNEMKVEAVNWPERRSGHPSTAGTTCSCAFIRDERIYVAHVGDSRIVLVGNEEASFVDLTNDHKPELPSEEDRIVRAGGSITKSSSVARVNWKRPRSCHSDIYDTIAFLSLSRSLGDYWSYNETTETYIVSPEPECTVHVINNERDKVLVLVSDGITHAFTSEKIAQLINGYQNCPVRNFAQHLLHEAVVRWGSLKADNMSVLCVGLHQDDEQTFNDDSESAIDCSIDEHLIINPQDIVRLYSSRLCSTTLANDGPQFYKQEKPESSQSDSSRTSVRTCNLSEMNASLDDYMISKKRTLTASDEDSELVRSFCTPVRNGIHQRPLPLVPTFDWKVESQQRSPTEPCSRLIVDFLSDEGTPAKKPRVLKEL